jgi:protein-L-isoaspartate(D-aspartate) O-methyltransferase
VDAASMVDEQLVPRGITDQRVLAAMRSVKRHKFVPFQYRLSAYYDGPLPIGYGQTISQPYIVALMTQLLETESDATALEIGTGSGYQAAVLAELVKHVYTVETIRELADRARRVLESEGYSNVTVYHRDGSYGLPEHAPYERIMVTAAAERVPAQLKEQLADGGIMVIPIGPAYGIQVLRQIRRVGNDFKTTDHEYVRFVPFTGDASQPSEE